MRSISYYKKIKLSDYDSYCGFLGKGDSGEKLLNETRRSNKEKKRTIKLKNK